MVPGPRFEVPKLESTLEMEERLQAAESPEMPGYVWVLLSENRVVHPNETKADYLFVK